ncbi:hypothetical protein Hokovirus_2_164 [Hokovirus HKV1]|uniref:Uncharacterized protein n=1 Tax=Hokovirus HKV1 TaxID=1977638 RepID=A0A1V0SFZ5_9VIRU|nr:hypothetical protein Hokovirus_2_164 [Hokovirus HKV1]
MKHLIFFAIFAIVFIAIIYYGYNYISEPKVENFDGQIISDAFKGLSSTSHNLANEYYNRGTNATNGNSYTYPIFSDTVPPEEVSPVDDMTNISDNYLHLNKPYEYDGSRLTNFPDNYYLLNDGKDEEYALTNNLCSKSCCAPQWPLPFKMDTDQAVCKNKDNLVSSSYMCNTSLENAGCLCMTNEQANYLTSRGGNAGKDVFTY